MHSKMTQTRCLAIAAWRFTTELLQDWILRYVKPILTPPSYTIETSGYDGEKPLLTADASEAFKMKGIEACEGNFPFGFSDYNFCKRKIAMCVDSTLSFQEKILQFYVRVIHISTDPIWPSYREICLQYILRSDRQLISPNQILSLPSQS